MHARTLKHTILALALTTLPLLATALPAARADSNPTIMATTDSVAANVLYVLGRNFHAGAAVDINVLDARSGAILGTITVRASSAGRGGEGGTFARGFPSPLPCPAMQVTIQAREVSTNTYSNAVAVTLADPVALAQNQIAGAERDLHSLVASPPATSASAATWAAYTQKIATLEAAIDAASRNLVAAQQHQAQSAGSCAAGAS